MSKKLEHIFLGWMIMLLLQNCRSGKFIYKAEGPVTDEPPAFASRATELWKKSCDKFYNEVRDFDPFTGQDSLLILQCSDILGQIRHGDTLYLLMSANSNHGSVETLLFDRRNHWFFDGNMQAENNPCYDFSMPVQRSLSTVTFLFVKGIVNRPDDFERLEAGANPAINDGNEYVFSVFYLCKGKLIVRSVFSEFFPFIKTWQQPDEDLHWGEF